MHGNDNSQEKYEFIKDNKCGFFHYNKNLIVKNQNKKLFKNFSGSFTNQIRPQDNDQFLATKYFRIHYALDGPNAIDLTDIKPRHKVMLQ